MKRRNLVGWILVVLLLIPAGTYAGQWWKDEALKGKLKLTEEQEKKIDAIVDASFKRRRDKIKRVREKSQALNAMLGKEKIDRKEIDRAIAEIIKLRGELLRSDLDMKLKVRDVLSEKQIKTLIEERPRVFSMRSRWVKGRIPFEKLLKKQGIGNTGSKGTKEKKK